MEAIHNTNSQTRITKFDLSKTGANTLFNITSDNAFNLAGAFLGVWFSDHVLDNYKFSYEYEIEDKDYMIIDSLADLESYMYDEIQKIEEITAYELFNNPDKLIELAEKVRQNILNEGFTGISITNDEEFGGESLIAIDTDTIN